MRFDHTESRSCQGPSAQIRIMVCLQRRGSFLHDSEIKDLSSQDSAECEGYL